MGSQKRRQLPYLTLSRHGIYKYRRSVPRAQQASFGLGKEFIRSLGTRDPKEAKNLWTCVHFEFEQLLKQPPRAGLRKERGLSRQVPAKAVSERPRSTEAHYCLLDAKKDYFAEKGFNLSVQIRSSERNNRLLVERVVGGLTELLGEKKTLVGITRQDALSYRDRLFAKGKAPGTVKKYIEIAHAVFQVALVSKEFNKANPFRRLPVNDDMLERDKRLPLKASEIRLLLGQRKRMNTELADILTLLVHTGARLGEISGLAVDDFDAGLGDDLAFINICPNSIRRLKTRSSRRQVPLTHEALLAVQAALARLPKPSKVEMPLFPRYGRDGGSDAASAALMKVLRRAGITDKRKAIHSIRHSMKDALRAVECPEDLRDAIQGHSHQTVAASYGSGHTVEAKYKWLARAVATLLPTAEA